MLRSAAPYLAYAYMTFVGWTTRWRVLAGEHRAGLRRRGQRCLLAFWHQRQVFFTYTHRGAGAKVLVSRSRDGEIIARVMELSGIQTARGSSSRGFTAALKEMVRTVSEGLDIGITPDGPKGPAREVKDGAVFLAQKLGIPILPITNSLTNKLVFGRSWDKFQLPLPFGRGIVRYGAPIVVGPSDDVAAKAAEVKAALDAITEAADREVLLEPPLAEALLARSVAWCSTLVAPAAALAFAVKVCLSPRRKLLRSLPEEWAERTGRPGAGALRPLRGRPALWVHAASVGEVAAAQDLIAGIRALPGSPAVVVTCATAAGRERARTLAGVDAALLAPLDSLPTVRSFLRAVRPYGLLLLETELWPAMIELSFREGVRIGMANGRLSPRSFAAYRCFAGLTAPFLRRIERLAVQTEADAARFAALGAPAGRVRVCGNTKFDLVRLPAVLGQAREALARLGWQDCPILVAGSTHPVEEEAVVAAFREARRERPTLRLVLAPRHVERSRDAAAMLARAGVRFVLWSSMGLGASAAGGPSAGLEGCECLVVDAMGILSSWYALGTVCVVGGTLVPVGGHNLLEPASHGKAVVFGPHTFHTDDTARALEKSGGGVRVGGPDGLGPAVRGLLADPGHAAQAGARALETLRSLQGAIERTMAHLGPCLDASRL
ncbi:MAG: DUF374 domain-containing protein [Elusimicrobia bacterium]|nr:DUF374 domain-containing protein [Elusimicrobiota bacterium]